MLALTALPACVPALAVAVVAIPFVAAGVAMTVTQNFTIVDASGNRLAGPALSADTSEKNTVRLSGRETTCTGIYNPRIGYGATSQADLTCTSRLKMMASVDAAAHGFNEFTLREKQNNSGKSINRNSKNLECFGAYSPKGGRAVTFMTSCDDDSTPDQGPMQPSAWKAVVAATPLADGTSRLTVWILPKP